MRLSWHKLGIVQTFLLCTNCSNISVYTFSSIRYFCMRFCFSKFQTILNILHFHGKRFLNLPSATFKAIPLSFLWFHQMLNLWLEFAQKEIINWFMVQFEKLHKMQYTNIALCNNFFFVRSKIPGLEGWMQTIKYFSA